MRINYGDTGLIVNYIQMFLKEYYSKFINVEYEYSREVQENLIKYINSPDSIEMIDMVNELSEFRNNPELSFKVEERVDEIILIAKMPNISKYPENQANNQAVRWLNSTLTKAYNKNETFEEFLLKRGWHITNFSYRNTEDKCEVIISKLNKNVLPKDAIYDLINMYDAKYTEMSFTTDNYFSSLYNFEIVNYLSENENAYKVCIPPPDPKESSPYEIIRTKTGNYNIMKGDQEVCSNFRGFKTFVTNTYIEKDKYYAIYIKRPKNYKFDPTADKTYAYFCYSTDIGKRLSIDYSGSKYIDFKPTSVFAVLLDNSSHSSDYLCVATKVANNIEPETRICVSIYDPDNEIDSILVYKIDENQIKDDFRTVCQSGEYIPIYPDEESMRNYFKIRLISPSDYYNDPFAIHEKLLSYILEAVVHEYSRESDIISIQKLANKLGYFYDEYSYGTYDNNLKEFITLIQNSYVTKDGKLVEYGKGYTDPDTESILNSYLSYKLGGDDYNGN